MNPVLVALDYPRLEEALDMARALASQVGGFKVGLELLMGHGPEAIGVVSELGLPVLADAKLHDIPTTVERAARGISDAGARWVTVHLAGGRAMVKAAVEAMEGGVLGVTVLTSLDEPALAGLGVTKGIEPQVRSMAGLAHEAGAEGVICSPFEVPTVKQVSGDLLAVTPGIRLDASHRHDQLRVTDPVTALSLGADLLVIGRAITRAIDPVKTAESIAKSLAETGVV